MNSEGVVNPYVTSDSKMMGEIDAVSYEISVSKNTTWCVVRRQ